MEIIIWQKLKVTLSPSLCRSRSHANRQGSAMQNKRLQVGRSSKRVRESSGGKRKRAKEIIIFLSPSFALDLRACKSPVGCCRLWRFFTMQEWLEIGASKRNSCFGYGPVWRVSRTLTGLELRFYLTLGKGKTGSRRRRRLWTDEEAFIF